MRLGLCCTFLEAPLKFRATTARYVGAKPLEQQRLFLGELALDNADALLAAVAWCADHGVGAFRITSQLFPLVPVCARVGLPLVYDVHHHRCLPDRYGIEEAAELAAATWGDREPWAHISSPKEGYRSKRPQAHHDYVRPRDVPRSWLGRRLTVDVEAKAKERAVLRLLRWVDQQERAAEGRALGDNERTTASRKRTVAKA
jgi:UV DNA damage repair endonuclease